MNQAHKKYLHWRCSSVGNCLLGMCRALHLIPSISKQKANKVHLSWSLWLAAWVLRWSPSTSSETCTWFNNQPVMDEGFFLSFPQPVPSPGFQDSSYTELIRAPYFSKKLFPGIFLLGLLWFIKGSTLILFYCSLVELGFEFGFHACKPGAQPLEPYSSPFCSGYFRDGGRVSWTICPGGPWSLILPISASQVAKLFLYGVRDSMQFAIKSFVKQWFCLFVLEIEPRASLS
jgi:hypothetical protein